MTIQTSIKPAAVAVRIAAVRRRHRRLDDRVVAEHRRPQPDTSVLQMLKRERLRLKDELQHYEGLMRTLSRGSAAT